MICILTGLIVLSCAKAPETNRNANEVVPAGTPVPAGSVVTNRNTNSPGTTAAADKIGIEECDSFLTAYDNCVTTKVPENVRAQYQQAITNWRTSWKKLAETPATRATLASICKNQLETARAQFKAYNCTF
jgi:hypothetical protein